MLQRLIFFEGAFIRMEGRVNRQVKARELRHSRDSLPHTKNSHSALESGTTSGIIRFLHTMSLASG